VAASIGPGSNFPEALAQLGSLAARYHIPETDESRLGRETLHRIAGRVADYSNYRDVMKQFDEVVTLFRIPIDDAAPIRRDLLREIISLLSCRNSLSGEDVDCVRDLVDQLNRTGNVDNGVRESVARINKKVAIENWNVNDPPRLECAGLLLKKGEICHWEEPARLYEQKTSRQYAGVSQGISIPLGHGLRYRVGAFKGTPIDRTYLSDCGVGTLHITSARVCFTGDQQSFAIEWSKVINISLFSDGFSIHKTGAKKPTFVQVSEPGLTMQIASLVGPNSVA
jgi:hypothetical protein